MQPLSRTSLVANAFRVLGLGADASQEAIDSAARRMRLWGDPQRIPPTPQDLPWLGPLPRTKNDLEQAVARLHDPELRLQERALWFVDAPALAGEEPVALAAAAERLASETSHAGLHDAALLRLHLAWQADSDSAGERWTAALQSLARVADSAEYRRWFESAERDGEFEKPASALEIAASLHSLPGAIVALLGSEAEAALERGDLRACAGLVQILQNSGAAVGQVAECRRSVLNRLEDIVQRQCTRLFDDFRQRIRCDRNNFEGNKLGNRIICTEIAHEYNEHVAPTLIELQRLASEEPERVERARSAAAKIMGRLALGWVWAGEYLTADRTFEGALDLARGSQLERGLQADRAENAERARREEYRTFSNAKVAKTKKRGNWRSWWLIFLFLSPAIRALTSLNDSHISSGPSPETLQEMRSSHPNFETLLRGLKSPPPTTLPDAGGLTGIPPLPPPATLPDISDFLRPPPATPGNAAP